MMRRIERAVETILRTIAILAIVVLFTLIFVNVIARSFELASFAWFDEIVRGSFAYMVFFGTAALWIERDHFQVNWLELSLPGPRSRWVLRSVIAILSLGFFFVMTWYGWVLFNKANAMTPILQLPERMFYAAIPISGAIMAIHTIATLVAETLHTFKSGDLSI